MLSHCGAPSSSAARAASSVNNNRVEEVDLLCLYQENLTNLCVNA